MSISLSKRLIVWMTQKRSEQEKSCRGGKVLYPSSHRSVFFKRTQKKLNGRGEKTKCSPVRFHFCLGFPYLIYIEKETLFIFSLFHFGQPKLLV